MLMLVVTPRGLAGAAAIPALALGLAACDSGSTPESNGDDAVQLSPEQAVLASYDGLAADSYTMEMTVTVNDLDFLDATSLVEGEASRISQDLHLSAILEATGQDLSDPEIAEMMESALSDMHTETIVVDGVAYLQLSGGALGASSEEFGEDAWFTVDLAETGDLSEIHEQVGSLDLASQTERLLNDMTNVEETGDGVYTGTLSEDSELVQSLRGATGDPAGQAALDPVEVVVTVGDAGLLETMEMTFPEVDGVTMHIVSEVVEVGGAYGIAAPDSDNLHPFEDLVGSTQ
jgi:hypothetical protein